jgi:hypothetical protein
MPCLTGSSHLIQRYPGTLTIAAGLVAAPLFEAVPGLSGLRGS